MRSRIRRSVVATVLALTSSGALLTGCAATVAASAGSSSTPSIASNAHAFRPCTAAEAAGLVASLDAGGRSPETRFSTSAYKGLPGFPALTQTLIPSCVFHGKGTQNAFFLGATKATYTNLVRAFVGAGFKKLDSEATVTVFLSPRGEQCSVAYQPNGSDFGSLAAMVKSQLVLVSG